MRASILRVALLASSFLLQPTVARAQDAPKGADAPALAPTDKLCSKCKSKGRIPNPALDEKAKAREEGCLHCSERIEKDPAGKGLPFIPCKGCQTVSLAKAAQAEFETLAKAETEWLAARRKIDAKLKPRIKLIHIETAHFQLTFGLDKVVLEDRTVLDAHAAAHLYAKRLEEFYAWFQKLLNTTDAEARNLKHQIYLLDDMKTLMVAATEFAQLPTDRAGRAVGDPSILTTWRDKQQFKSDGSFHQHVLHHVSHLLLGVFHLKVWLADDAGWLEEGLAHYVEMKLFTKSGNSCNIEGTGEHMVDADWEPLVRKMVAAGPTTSFAELMQKKAYLLTEPEHYLAWSYTDFLIARKPEALREMVKQVKEKKPQRDALREVYGLTTTGIDEQWRAYVLENYRTKPIGER